MKITRETRAVMETRKIKVTEAVNVIRAVMQNRTMTLLKLVMKIGTH